MTNDESRRKLVVLTAAAAMLVLLVSLAARVSARVGRAGDRASLGPAPSAAEVVPPRPIVLEELPTPFCWGCSWQREAPLEFQLDLDLLAPLGDGPDNAAVWFQAFAKGGPKPPIDESIHERRIVVTIDGREWMVLPGDDPALLAAEPWVDQATLRFYPKIWEVRGFDTRIPNLLMMMDLAKSWVVRGKLADDADSASEDFRRAIRLGRLLRQDDVTLIQDLVGIACIRFGAEALYEQARDQGDAATMIVAGRVLADKDAMRLMTAQRITILERAMRVEDPTAEELVLQLTDAQLETITELIRESPERRFRMEGLIGLHVVKHLGTSSQRRRALQELEELSDADDPIVAEQARKYRDSDLDEEQLRSMFSDSE